MASDIDIANSIQNAVACGGSLDTEVARWGPAPQWTRITSDPKTWPPYGPEFVLFCDPHDGAWDAVVVHTADVLQSLDDYLRGPSLRCDYIPGFWLPMPPLPEE